MVHRTYRRLDEATRFAGLSLRAWLGAAGGGGLLGYVLHLSGVSWRVGVPLWVFAVVAPAALAFVSESGRAPITRRLADLARWSLSAKRLDPDTEPPSSAVWLTPDTATDPGRARQPLVLFAAGTGALLL